MLIKYALQKKVQEVWWKERSVFHQSKKTRNWLEHIVHTLMLLAQDSMSCPIPLMGNKYYQIKRIPLILAWRAGLAFLIFHNARLNFKAKMPHRVLLIHPKYTKLNLRTLVFLLASHLAFRVFKMKSILSLNCHLLTLKTWSIKTIRFISIPLRVMAKNSLWKLQRMMKMDQGLSIRLNTSNQLSTL